MSRQSLETNFQIYQYWRDGRAMKGEKMSIFDKIIKKEKNKSHESVKRYDNDLMEIVRIVSFDNADVLKDAQDCIDDTAKYYKKHKTDYEERGISEEEELTLLQWIGCIDLLIKFKYVCECDWKEEKDTFLSQLSALKGMSSFSLKINSKWLDAEQSVPEWCEKLEEKWEKTRDVIAAFDIDSDSYLIFLCKESDLGVLKGLADNFGYRIEHAKNM